MGFDPREWVTALTALAKHLVQILVNQDTILVKNSGKFVTRPAPRAQPNSLIFMALRWKPDPESNRGTRLCRSVQSPGVSRQDPIHGDKLFSRIS